jgi:hypothetical protein
MNITRENHLRYMARLAPFLVVGLVIQTYLYRLFVPQEMATDVSIFVGALLSLMLIGFYVYNEFHKVKVHANYLELRFDLLGHHQEIIFKNIIEADIDKSRHGYANLKFTMKDGSTHRILYIDQGSELYETILSRTQIQLMGETA